MVMLHNLFYLFSYFFGFSKSEEFSLFDSGLITSPLGTDGFDINNEQSVAIRFFSNIQTNLDSIDLLMMTNVFSEPYPVVNISLSKGGELIPQLPFTLIESVSVNVSGWTPTIITVKSLQFLSIEAGEFYWIILESDNYILEDALWNLSGTLSFMSFSKCDKKCDWQEGNFGGSACIVVKGV